MMKNDNTTPLAANEFDKKINNTIPYYPEFYLQTLDIVKQCAFESIDWLDLGCGTGTLEEYAFQESADIRFVLVDPSEKMLEQAKLKLKNDSIEYINGRSDEIRFENRFDVVTAIQSHHYMRAEQRRKATGAVFRALRNKGIFLSFENVVPEDESVKSFELQRWARYQQRNGKTLEEAKAHNARCGTNYFPLTVNEHIQLLKDVGFRKIYVFWRSYMQMGIYGIK